MAENKTIQLKRSSALNAEGNGPKLPTVEQLEYGEIAINYAVGHETISLKNSDNEIVPIKINGDGKILTQDDVVDKEPEILTEDYKKKPASAFRSFTGLNALSNKIYGANGLESKVVNNTGAIANNTEAIKNLNTGLDKIALEVHGDGTTEKPGLIKRVKSNEDRIATNETNIATNKTKIEGVVENLKSFINDIYKSDMNDIITRLTALENQLKGVETQTTSIISQEDNIITNAQ